MSTAKPKVIGLYGLPAAGKTTLIRKLKGQLPHPEFVFYDGSTVLADQNGGTLKGFNQLSDHEKKQTPWTSNQSHLNGMRAGLEDSCCGWTLHVLVRS